ncbi:MAG: hypothetical protein QN188_05895 [Armatimonadota bacterium]|nr:hypothetical protein [Armatimonadota bacterium]MDR5684422.1 hypothetical protein [Armatimonadota bacterium]MDR7390053.1 hypothetical protein [Armatimonadota bacterium]MDR7390757.1 hypothetical protein [Armatimonadota bacterium]MDR7394231.1 hypothetical protein [Armatimonadota bacterium]
MPLYIADCDVPGIPPEQVRDLAVRARAACEEAAQGTGVHYLLTLWIPADWRVMVLFQAQSADAVRAVCQVARTPLLRVVEVVEVCGT